MKGSIISSIMLCGFVIAAIIYMPAMFGAADEGVDLTGTDYEDQYDSVTTTSTVSVNMVQFAAYGLALCAVFGALGMMAKNVMSNKRRF